jgi:ABC-type transport system involved in cytochrome c biogenesis ATPase subunit
MPTLHVVAGPNGCGKSTLTRMSGFSEFDIIGLARETPGSRLTRSTHKSSKFPASSEASHSTRDSAKKTSFSAARRCKNRSRSTS